MPQLDFVIIFPQIFWFFLLFIILYIFIVHIFLPNIVISLKFRKKIISNNEVEVQLISDKLITNKQKIYSSLLSNLNKLKSSFILDLVKINKIFLNTKLSNPHDLNKKLVLTSFDLVFYCNKYILDLILIKPTSLEFKNK